MAEEKTDIVETGVAVSKNETEEKRGAPKVKDAVAEILEKVNSIVTEIEGLKSDVEKIKHNTGFFDQAVEVPTKTNYCPDRLPHGVQGNVSLKEYQEMQKRK